jgi:hypothetical protein
MEDGPFCDEVSGIHRCQKRPHTEGNHVAIRPRGDRDGAILWWSAAVELPRAIHSIVAIGPISKGELVPALPKYTSRGREQGYTGDTCSNCQSLKMVKTGTCSTCQNCGTTSGCS